MHKLYVIMDLFGHLECWADVFVNKEFLYY